MTVSRRSDGTIELVGTCGLSDVEPLMQQLLADPAATLDWRGCEQCHTAVLQIIMLFHPVLDGPPANIFLRNFIHPTLGQLDN